MKVYFMHVAMFICDERFYQEVAENRLYDKSDIYIHRHQHRDLRRDHGFSFSRALQTTVPTVSPRPFSVAGGARPGD